MFKSKEVYSFVIGICVIGIVFLGIVFSIYRIHAWYCFQIWKQIGVYSPYRSGYVCDVKNGCWRK